MSLSFSSLKIFITIALLGVLGACASSSQSTETAPAHRVVRTKAPTSGLEDATGDLRKSTKFSTLSQNIRFTVASSQLSPSSRRALDEIAKEMRNSHNSYERVRVSGLADPTGDAERNLRLSLARADAVRNYLISKGVPEDKIEAVGGGPVRADAIATATQHARDRRVDFEIVE